MAIIDWNQHFSDEFGGKPVLVTGGAGFIGSHLTEALIDLGAKVCVLDDLSGADRRNLESLADRAGRQLHFVEGSILDQAVLDKCMAGCRWVFHQAALGSVPRSVEQPARFIQVNVTGTLNVLEAARRAGVERVLFAASSSAYGDSETLPKIETMPIRARSPYAASKAACEALMSAYAACYALDTVSLRYFNIFGPRQNANSAYAAVIAAFAKSLFAGERPAVFGDGEQSRDFTFVDNAVYANLLAARNERPLGGVVMNIASGRSVTVNELAQRMASSTDQPHLVPTHEDERTGDVKHSLAELTLARETMGYEPVVDFATGLDCTVQWYGQELALSREPGTT